MSFQEKGSWFMGRLFEGEVDGGPPNDIRIRAVVEKTVRHFDGKSVDWSFEARR